jgi:hypothetical protein
MKVYDHHPSVICDVVNGMARLSFSVREAFRTSGPTLRTEESPDDEMTASLLLAPTTVQSVLYSLVDYFTVL